jgi:hypothetical protein
MRKSSLAVLGGTALLAACSSSLAPSLGGPAKTGDPAGGDAGGSPYRGSDGGISVTSALRPITSCSDLTVALHDDARAKMDASVDAQIKTIRAAAAAAQDAGGVYFGPNFGGGGVSGNPGGGFAAVGAAVAAPPQANTGATTGAAATGTSSTATPAHSETETQVKGVDEADIVKTDGQNIYVLHGNAFLVAAAWPPTALGISSSLTIEGNPSEMYVEGTQAVVFSQVDGTAIYAAAGVNPRPTYSDPYVYTGGGVALGGGGGFVGGPSLPGGVYVNNPLTKVTVLTLTGAAPSVTRELYFEGSYLSSRRIDQTVRAVLTGGAHGPTLLTYPEQPVVKTMTTPDGTVWTSSPGADEYVNAWEQVRAENNRRIDATTYTDWVPLGFTKDGSTVTAAPTACDAFYVPPAGTTDFGVTTLETFALDAPTTPPQATAILGSATTVYGNDEAMVLAMQAYQDPWLIQNAYTSNAAGTSASAGVTLDFTHLHLFDIKTDPKIARYVASGTVPGDVADQFAIDEKSGAVRVATTEQRTGYSTNGTANEVSHVYVLRTGSSGLAITGDAGEIAPGEQLYATRFVGDTAYIVTWHVTDPLFVVDVSDATKPRVVGQVQIPGFSTYIHPLDATHLLTIGRETDDTGHQHAGSYWYGLAIQVFDVTNPLAPSLQYKYVYDGGEYATSEAMEEHKAFTYFDDKKLLAFPYVRESSYGGNGPSSTLEVFQVGVAEGITKVGSVDHTSLLGTLQNGNYGYCGGYYDGAVRRGVFIDKYVYSISYGGIVASDVTQMNPPVSTLKLAPPTLGSGLCGG